MSEVDDAIDQIESHAALYREQRLRAEIERLRAALQEIKVLSWTTPEGHHIQDITRRALEGK